MKPTLQVRQSQQLKLTPQLHQSFHLLQLSTVDLDHEIEQALDSNPFLERHDDQWRDTVSLQSDSSLRYNQGDTGSWDDSRSASGSSPDESHEASASPDAEAQNASEDYAASSSMEQDSPWGAEGGTGARASDGDDDAPRDTFVPGESLHDHLRAQLRGTPCADVLRPLIEILIEEVDDRGYLSTSLESLHAELLAEDRIAFADLEKALSILQQFDPTGVGARSINECLYLQLQELATQPGTQNASLEIAVHIVNDDMLEMVARREFDKMRKLLRCSEALLHEAIALIRERLDPHPGYRFSAEQPTYIRPDVFVRRGATGWKAVLNDKVVPDIRVNHDYARLFKNHQNTKAGAFSSTHQAQWKQDNREEASTATPSDPLKTPPVDDSLGKQLQEAQWMVKNVQQRFETILRVAQAIVERQQAFFEQGKVGMQPLVLREIAEVVNLSESTISRATTQKYMETPHGVFELKYFFGSHVATESGGAMSSTAICELIRQLIEQEATHQPLSDNQLTELLGQRGILVARRTVAKYRESMQIPVASQRRKR